MPAHDAPAEETVSPGRMLAALFAFFEGQAIPYCVVGDTRAYPDRISGDVDIVVAPETRPGLTAQIDRFCRTQGCRLIQTFRHDRTATCYVLACTDRSGEHAFLHPDLCTDYYERGRLLLTARELLHGRVRATDARGTEKGFFVPRPDRAFVYYLLKKVGKGEINETHAAYLSSRWHLAPPACEKQLHRFWPRQTAGMLAACAAAQDWQPVRDAMALVQHTLRPPKHHTFASRVATRWHDLQRMRHPAGLWIALACDDAAVVSNVWRAALPLVRPAFLGEALLPSSLDVEAAPFRSAGPGMRLRRGLVYWTHVWPLLVHARLVASPLSEGPARPHLQALHRAGPGMLSLRRRLPDVAREPDLIFFILTRRRDTPGQAAARPGAYVLDASEPYEVLAKHIQRILVDHLAHRSTARLARHHPAVPHRLAALLLS